MQKKIFIGTSLLFILLIASIKILASNNLLFTVSSPALTLSVTTNIANHPYSFAGLKILNGSSYQLADSSSDCTQGINQGFCLFSANNTTPANITLSGKTGTAQLQLCLSAKGSQPFDCQNYSVSVTHPPYVYVSSDSTHTLYYCSVNASNGTLNTCTPTPSDSETWHPFQIAFATINGTQYAYVANNSTAGSVDVCTVNTDINTDSYGALTSCTPTGSFSGSPTGISVATVGSNQYVYISNNVGGVVTVCQIDTTTTNQGNLENCTNATSAFDTWPFATAFATVNGTQYAYVAGASNVYQCSLNTSNGTFSSCSSTYSIPASGTTNALGFATVNGTQYAYVLSYSPDYIYQCTVNSDGTLQTPCNPLTIPSMNPRGISFGTVSGTQYAYVADINGNMYTCDIVVGGLDNGSFSSCSVTPSTGAPSWEPRGVTVANIA